MSETYISQNLRAVVSRRARYCCEYCRSQEAYSPDVFSVEHIYPRSRGGATTPDNLALSCQGCNGHKSTRTKAVDPLTGEIAPIFHPRQHSWQEHFNWSKDFTQVIGKTPTGRATVIALQMNRDGLLNLRLILHQVGQHPLDEKEPP